MTSVASFIVVLLNPIVFSSGSPLNVLIILSNFNSIYYLLRKNFDAEEKRGKEQMGVLFFWRIGLVA